MTGKRGSGHNVMVYLWEGRGFTIRTAQGCGGGNILMHVGMGAGSRHMMRVMIIVPRLYDNNIAEERAAGWGPHCMR